MKDFLVTVWRSASRERSYALINLVGLALGFACCLILALFLRSELTYDRHFDKHERIYRVIGETTIGEQVRQGSLIPRAFAPLMAANYPQIETTVRFTDASLQDGLRLRLGDKVFNWRHTYFASDNVFRVFSHQVLAGDPSSALAAESSVAISASLARAYFGDKNPLGQLLRTDSGETWKVTLVFADLPPNTHLRYDALFSDKIPLLRDAEGVGLVRQMLGGYTAYIYLLMRPDFDPRTYKNIDSDFIKRYFQPIAGQSFKARTWLQPLASIHYGEPITGDEATGNRVYLYGCATVALLIVFVAGINYTNLAAARALRRARSTAIRKILGARRSRMFLEFLGEAVLYALIAAALGLAMAEMLLSLTPIGGLLGGKVALDLSTEPAILFWTLGAAVAVGLTAGIYPALYLSSWMPAAAFSNRRGGAATGSRLREALVLLQFVVAVGVVAVTLVMAAQMRYVANTPLGFQRDNQATVTVRGTDNFVRIPALAQELLRIPEVRAVTQTAAPPGRFNDLTFLGLEDAEGKMQSLRGGLMQVGAGFSSALGIQIVAGRDLAPESPSGDFLVNETLVRNMRWTDPIGKHVNDGRVIGVVRDFNFRSLREPILPLAIQRLSDAPGQVAVARRPFVQRTLIIRLSGQQVRKTLELIGEAMSRFDPGNPFEYTMLDDTWEGLYTAERRMLALIAIYATLCIFIACLGLFGLASFATERRSREIAIRKVLGASAAQVVWMLARRVLLLIGLGGLIAATLSWIVMDEWLTQFAYRVDINPALLALAVLLAATVALGTVALQSLRAARADPANELRHE